MQKLETQLTRSNDQIEELKHHLEQKQLQLERKEEQAEGLKKMLDDLFNSQYVDQQEMFADSRSRRSDTHY